MGGQSKETDGYKYRVHLFLTAVFLSISINYHFNSSRPTQNQPSQPTTFATMKTSFLSLLAIPAFFAGAFAAPAVDSNNEVAIEKRQVADAYSIVSSLYQDIQQYTGAISTSNRTPLPTKTYLLTCVVFTR